MNKRKFFIATLLVAAAVSVAVVSCKKETPNALHNNNSPSVKTFAVPQVDDMNAYLKDFKKKMQTATRDGNETLSLEEAAWHLSSVANYEFANANVDCDDVRFDTLYAQVNITDGAVRLCDLGLAYEEISASIDKFYNSLALDNKHFRFINTFISENGEVAVPLITTFSNGSKPWPWYYDDEWILADSCYHYFPFSSYPVQTTGTSELQRVLNLIVSHPINNIGTVYYTYSSTQDFPHHYYYDPNGSPSYNYSRVFVMKNTINYDLVADICYYFDSYLGLGHEYCPNGKYILSWSVKYRNERSTQGERYYKEYHDFSVNYGIRHEINPEPGHNDF